MANTSILTAFERMWHYVVVALNNKSDATHNHDDKYYTQNQIDEKLQSKADSSHNHDDKYDTKGSANTALYSAKAYADTVASGKSDSTHNHDDKYDTKGTAAQAAAEALGSAKSYTDTKTSSLASTSYVDTAIDNIPAITIDEINEICGQTIQMVSATSRTF